MSVRAEVADMLRTDWADVPKLADVRVIATEREMDDIQTPTALIRVKSIGKAPSAPNSHRHVGLLLTLISQHLDAEQASTELDDKVAAALDYLDTTFMHGDADAVGYGDRLAFDIPLTILASKD